MGQYNEPIAFTYDWYRFLIDTLRDNGYTNADYDTDFDKTSDTFILRHDIDNSIAQALELARIEYELGVRSTYFTLLSSDFYNVASKRNLVMIDEIRSLGHTIGLHFDEVAYAPADGYALDVPALIKRECNIMGEIIGVPITTVSMHRPSKPTLEANYVIPGIINSYGKRYFNDFKYLSDSRFRWREPIIDIIRSRRYSRLHILTHPIWYNNKPTSMREVLANFIADGAIDRYNTEKENITDLESILTK